MSCVRLTNIAASIATLTLLISCTKFNSAPTPTAKEIYIDSEQYGHFVDRIEIQQGERVIREITFDEARWEGEEFGPVRIRLPYEAMAWAADQPEASFSVWDSLVAGGPPTLVVQEYVSGGSAPGSHRWVMRIFQWEKDALRELLPIAGAGEVYNFKDLNGDGLLEFVNQEGLSVLPKTEDGLPVSRRVYRFDGKRYLPIERDIFDPHQKK